VTDSQGRTDVSNPREASVRHLTVKITTRPTWDQYGMILAEAVASRSEDPRHKVGAVIMRQDHSVVSVGYNGPPPGVDIDWTKDWRHNFIIHAEVNALRYARLDDTRHGVIYTTRHPCGDCLKTISAYGILEIHWKEEPGVQHDLATLDIVARRFGILTIRESE